MKYITWFAFTVLAGLAGYALHAQTTQPTGPAPALRFQYRVITFDPKTDINHSTINEAGREGWELVTVVFSQGCEYFYFKRTAGT